MFISAMVIMTIRYSMAENWVMVVSEMHRYQGVSYKSDIIVISGLVINILSHHHYHPHPHFYQVLTLVTGKCLSRNTAAVSPPVSLTLQMEGTPPCPQS